MVKVNEAKFITSAVRREQYPYPELPEVAFSGRSNVGKSSMINCLLSRHRLARTSSTPGHTRLINFYLVNRRWYFVDLPGYGYAKVPVEVRRSWKRIVEEYLESRKQLKLVVIIIDLRRGLEEDELNFLLWLKEQEIPALVVATKADKVKKSQRPKAISKIKAQLKEFPEVPVIEFSARTKEGREEVWRHLLQVLEK